LGELAADLLRPDFYEAGRWQAEKEVELSAYYIEWRRGQVARFLPFLHNPTVCLPMAGCELESELGLITVSWQGLEIPFHAYKFRRAGSELWVAFTIWDPSRGRPLAQTPDGFAVGQWWRERWQEVREKRQDQPAQLFTLAIIGGRGDPLVDLQKALKDRLVSP